MVDNLVFVRQLLAADADPDACDESQHTALHHAAGEQGSNEVARELIEMHNANMLAVDKDGLLPFDRAAICDDERDQNICDCLLQLYGNKATQYHGRLALHVILRSAEYSFSEERGFHPPLLSLRIRLPLGKYFVKLSKARTYLRFSDAALIRNQDDSGKLPIHIACEAKAPVELLVLLVEMDPATLQIAEHTGSLPLHVCCCGAVDDSSVCLLVEQGGVGTLAARNHKGALPLHNLVASTNPPVGCVQ